MTSALPYANGPIHLGHLSGAYLPADIYVRYKRLNGVDILYVCGSDEHGVPITITADKEKISVRLFAIIYQLAEDVRNEIEQRMPVDIVTEDIGRVKILKVFFSTAKRKIVGGEVAEGIVEPNAKIIIKRKDKLKKDAPAEHIGTGVIVELQKDKRPLQKAEIGDQVGMTIEGRDKMKEGDVLEIYRETRVRKGSVPQK